MKKNSLAEENKTLKEKVEHLNGLLSAVMEENAKLKEQLGLNSRNSSKPPSTDKKKNVSSPQPGVAIPYPIED
jgi:transposase